MSIRIVVIQPTSFCNINCSYCYLANREDHLKIDLKLLDEVISKVVNSNIVNNEFEILWHAGEPLTAGIPFFQHALDLCIQANLVKNKMIVNNIQTNGILINTRWCNFLKLNKFKIGVSIDGPQFLHDYNRKAKNGAGTFHLTMRGIDLLKQFDIKFGCLFVVTKKSLHYAEEIFHFFLDNSFSWVGFNVESIISLNKSSSITSNDKVDNLELYKIFITKLFKLYLKYKNQIRIREFETVLKNINYKKENPAYIYSPIETNELDIITINKFGDITTHCPELADGYGSDNTSFKICNIKDIKSLDEIVENKKRKKIYAEIQKGIQECSESCSYFDFCGGGSPSTKLYENGTFASTKTTNCFLTRQLLLDVILENIENYSVAK